VRAQEHVALLDKNGLPYFELLFGCAKLNAVDVAVNWRLAPPEVAAIVDDARARVLVVGQEFVPVLEAIEDRLATVDKILVVGGHPRHEDFDAWVARQSPVDPGGDGAPDDVALQLYSSGTTGLPKGIMISNDSLFALMPLAAREWSIGPGSKTLVAMPLFHIGGGGWAIVGLVFGCECIVVRDVDPAAIARLIASHRITHAFLVPAVLQFMLALPGVEKIDFASLRTIVYGASPISVQILKQSIATFGCGFAQAYGLTETTGAIVTLPPSDHDPDGPNAHRLRSAGRANEGVELRIVKPDGSDAAVGEVGEIWVRSRQNMKGYWNRPDETRATIVEGGWLRTGDAGYLDADGYLYIHDRVKDMIVSGGENVYPAEIENVLMSHPAIADAAVIGVPSERWGETPKALLVRKPGADATEADVIAFCRERLARYKCPTSVDWVEALPRNPSGKILKKDLRAPYWAGRARMVN